MKTVLLVFVFCLTSVSGIFAQQTESGPAEFDSVSEIIQRWTPSQHLWVHGNVGVAPKQLADLETWLDEAGPNWTIVLMKNASGQTWKNFRGMNAVEHALGKGLSNQSGFGKLTDTRTDEANGAVFVLFLAERKFSYFASDTFDKRGLGESKWIGYLDKKAIGAMRSGGRIIDAVKGTVSSIEQQLTRKLAEEKRAQQRALIEKKRLIEESKQLAGKLNVSIQEADNRAAGIRKTNPLLTGDLVNPDLGAWTANAKAIDEYAANEDYTNAHKLADSTRKKIAAFHEALRAWSSQGEGLDDLATRIERHPKTSEVPELDGYLSTAAEALASGRINHAKGDSLYATQLAQGIAAVDNAERAYQRWLREEEEKRRRDLAKQRLVRILFALAIILLIAGMIVANRLRVPAKKEAEEELKRWKQELRGKFDQLFNLMDRTALMSGSDSQNEDGGRGFTGETKTILKKTVRGVDELFIMSTATDHVMEMAGDLVSPRSPWGIFQNALSKRRYQKALALLASKPIGFDRSEGLDAILTTTSKKKNSEDSRSLLGRSEDYKPFRMSFKKLIAAYDKKQDKTRTDLERLEYCVDGLPQLQERIAGDLKILHQKADQLHHASGEDSWFPLQMLRDKLIPGTEEKSAEAADMGKTDPITAMENPASVADRQVTEALRMVNEIESVRKVDFPVIQNSVDSLEDSSRRTGWVDQEMDSLIARSEQLATLAVSQSVSESWTELEDDITSLKGRIVNSVKLVDRSGSEILPAIEKRKNEVATATETISRDLGLEKEKVLSEDNLSPGRKVELATHQLEAALAALDHGNIHAAQEAYHEIESHLGEADEQIQLSLDALENQPERHTDFVSECQTTNEKIPEVQKLLATLQSDYAPSVVLFSARYGEKASGQQSVSNSIQRAETHLSLATEAVGASKGAYENGKLIASYGLLERAGNELGFAGHQLALVEDQYNALKKAEGGNTGKLSSLLARHKDQNAALADHRTCEPTIAEHELIGRTLLQDESQMKESKPDPFAVFYSLEKQVLNLNAIDSGTEADWNLFGKAEASEVQALDLIKSCGKYVHQAKTDRIADSTAITRAIRKHEQLSGEANDIGSRLKISHGDWASVFESLTALISETAKVRLVLQKELKAAREALDQINEASSQIQSLSGWRSSYSVKIDRNAGTGNWRDASDRLSRGDYVGARRQAIAARGEAKLALSRAEGRESKKRAAAAAAAAAARRRAAAAARRSSSSSFSSSSRSSGFSSSSFSSSSSSSGFSRSGW